MAQHTKVNENYAPWEEQRFRPGDIAAGGMHASSPLEVASDQIYMQSFPFSVRVLLCCLRCQTHPLHRYLCFRVLCEQVLSGVLGIEIDPS